jgi:Kelch motif protein/von Hippel-Lindau disease tumor suppressor protein
MANGSVLLAGGVGSSLTRLSSAELFFPIEPPFDGSRFTPSATSMTTARWAHAEVKLPNGKVLIVGGVDANAGGTVVATAELLDPVTGNFTSTGSMGVARYYSEAVLLPNGKVLVAGGGDNSGFALSSAEVYDPATGSFTPTANNMSVSRWVPSAVRLANGKVLVLGGIQLGISGAGQTSADLYDPATNSFSATGSLNTARHAPTATLLPNGKVLVAGGRTTSGVPSTTLTTAELYDPVAGTFSFTGSMTVAHFNARAVLLPNGKVLVTAGRGTTNALLASAELYNPATSTFSVTGSMNIPRSNTPSFILLANGKALISGGIVPPGPVGTAEYYDQEIGLFFVTNFMTTDRAEHRAALLADGRALVTGGFNAANTSLASAEYFNPGPGSLLSTYSCSLEPTLHSISGTFAAAIKFTNVSTITQKVYWLDYSGTRQLFATLLPGQSYVQGTFFTHPWVVTDSGNACRGIYLPTPEASVAVLK